MSIILSLTGSRILSELLIRHGYRQVIRISGNDVIRIFGTRNCAVAAMSEEAVGVDNR